MASRRWRILQAVQARLTVISQANGYETDLGVTVLLHELPRFGPDDPAQALAILPATDIVGTHFSNIPITLPVDLAVIVKADRLRPGEIVEQGLSDIKRAMELDTDDALTQLLVGGGTNKVRGIVRGTTEPFERSVGSEITGALITYGLSYVEAWGHPEA
jgi:hypothetical protein